MARQGTASGEQEATTGSWAIQAERAECLGVSTWWMKFIHVDSLFNLLTQYLFTKTIFKICVNRKENKRLMLSQTVIEKKWEPCQEHEELTRSNGHRWNRFQQFISTTHIHNQVE